MIEKINFSENAPQPEDTPETNAQPRLIYVLKVGTDNSGLNIYRFLYSEEIDSVWMEQWSEKPACNCRFLKPEPSMYSYVKEIRTDVELILGQSCCCNSYGDVCDGVLSIAYESIDNAPTYPEPFRIVLHFGDTMEGVDKTLAQRDIVSKFVK